MAFAWAGAVVLVTGSGTGVGRAVAIECAARGAIVLASARSVEKCQPVVDDIRGRGGEAHAIVLDASDADAWARVVDEILTRFRRLDVLVNNAGIVWVGEYLDMDAEAINELVRTNLTGPMVGALYAYRQMKAQGAGRIVKVSSMGGFVANGSMTAYGATKFGLRGLTESLSAEAVGSGVTVQVAILGLVESEMLDKAEARSPGARSLYEVLPMRPQPTPAAARRIVDGIERGRRTFFTPRYAHLFFTLQRFFPGTVYKGAVAMMRRYREVMARTGDA